MLTDIREVMPHLVIRGTPPWTGFSPMTGPIPRATADPPIYPLLRFTLQRYRPLDPLTWRLRGWNKAPCPGGRKRSPMEREDDRIVSDSPDEGKLLPRRTWTRKPRANTRRGMVKGKMSVCDFQTGIRRRVRRQRRKTFTLVRNDRKR